MLSRDLKSAIIRSLTGKYLVYVVQLLSLAVLSRIFTPQQFGLVATVQVFVMFFQMLATSGLAPAVVYQERVPEKMRDGIYSFTLILGVLLAVIFLIIAKPLYGWFGFDDGLAVFYLLSISVFFSSLSMMPMASLQKDAKFISIAWAEMFAEIVSFVICIVAYQYVNGFLALGLKFLTIPVFRFLFYYFMSSKTEVGRPKIGRELGHISTLYGFAKYQVAFNVLNYCSRNLDNLLIAKYFGASMLGVYEKTYQVMKYPLQLFTFAITPALQPILTKYKTQPDVVYKEFSKVSVRLALVGFFSGTMLYHHAADVIFILFGDQWFESVSLLRIFALSIPLQMVSSATGGVFQAFGATKAMFKCGVFSSFVTISAICVGIYFLDIELMCYLIVVAFSINYIQCFYMLHRTVFEGQNLSNTLLSGFLSFLVFFNVLFSFGDYSQPESFFDALFSVAFTSIALIIPIFLLYLVLQKIQR